MARRQRWNSNKRMPREGPLVIIRQENVGVLREAPEALLVDFACYASLCKYPLSTSSREVIRMSLDSQVSSLSRRSFQVDNLPNKISENNSNSWDWENASYCNSSTGMYNYLWYIPRFISGCLAQLDAHTP